MREVTITREIKRGNKTYYEEIDYWNYLTTRKERIERMKVLEKKYPKSAIHVFYTVTTINYHLSPRVSD